MGKFTKEMLKIFGAASKDASPEEMEEMANTTANVLDAAPAQIAPEAEPTADVMVEKTPRGDELGSKLDHLIELMESVIKKNDIEEKKLSDENDLDKMIEKLSGGESTESEEDAITIPAEEMKDQKEPTIDADALSILKKVRPAIAAIDNKTERARVTDALLSAINSDNRVTDIITATQDAARRSIQSKKSYDEVCKEQKDTYDALNPHKNKEGK